MFKVAKYRAIVAAIAAINTREDVDNVLGMIDTAFQREEIRWKDHEVLFEVVGKISIEE